MTRRRSRRRACPRPSATPASRRRRRTRCTCPRTSSRASAPGRMPWRLAVERGAWREAAQLQPMQSKFPFTEALTYQARAIGAARMGDAAAAKADLERITEKRDALRAAKNDYWATEAE